MLPTSNFPHCWLDVSIGNSSYVLYVCPSTSLRDLSSSIPFLFLFLFHPSSFLFSEEKHVATVSVPWNVFAQRLRLRREQIRFNFSHASLSAHSSGRPWYAWWCSRQQPWHRRRIIHTLMNSLLPPVPPPYTLTPPPGFSLAPRHDDDCCCCCCCILWPQPLLIYFCSNIGFSLAASIDRSICPIVHVCLFYLLLVTCRFDFGTWLA